MKPELRFLGVIEKLDLEFCPEVHALTSVIIDFGYQNLEPWKPLILLGKMGRNGCEKSYVGGEVTSMTVTATRPGNTITTAVNVMLCEKRT